MKKIKSEEMFKKQVGLDEDEPCRHNHCERCYEPLVFAMRVQKQEFSVGLLTVLECLRLAEEEGAVPKLPNDWWISIHQQYDCQV